MDRVGLTDRYRDCEFVSLPDLDELALDVRRAAESVARPFAVVGHSRDVETSHLG